MMGDDTSDTFMMRGLIRGVLQALIVGVIATAVSLAIYRLLMVPRLPGWQQVPVIWWAFAFSPYLAAIVLLGHILERARYALINGLGLTLGSWSTTAILSRIGTSTAAATPDNPAAIWATVGGLIAGTLTATAAILLAYGTGIFIRRRRTGA